MTDIQHMGIKPDYIQGWQIFELVFNEWWETKSKCIVNSVFETQILLKV